MTLTLTFPPMKPISGEITEDIEESSWLTGAAITFGGLFFLWPFSFGAGLLLLSLLLLDKTCNSCEACSLCPREGDFPGASRFFELLAVSVSLICSSPLNDIFKFLGDEPALLTLDAGLLMPSISLSFPVQS